MTDQEGFEAFQRQLKSLTEQYVTVGQGSETWLDSFGIDRDQCRAMCHRALLETDDPLLHLGVARMLWGIKEDTIPYDILVGLIASTDERIRIVALFLLVSIAEEKIGELLESDNPHARIMAAAVQHWCFRYGYHGNVITEAVQQHPDDPDLLCHAAYLAGELPPQQTGELRGLLAEAAPRIPALEPAIEQMERKLRKRHQENMATLFPSPYCSDHDSSGDEGSEDDSTEA